MGALQFTERGTAEEGAAAEPEAFHPTGHERSETPDRL
jgi:hypothetical protein